MGKKRINIKIKIPEKQKKKKRLAVRVSEIYRQTCIHQYLMLKKIDFPKECFVLLQKMKKKRTTKLLVL